MLLRRGDAGHDRKYVDNQTSNFCALKSGYGDVIMLLRLGRDVVAMEARCLREILFLGIPKDSQDVASSER